MNIDIEKFKELRNEKKTRQEIADYFGVSLSTLKKFITNNNLQLRKDIDKEEFMKLYDQDKSDLEIAEILGISVYTIQSYRRKNSIPSQTDKIRKENYQKFLELYKQGLNDTEISKLLNVNHVTIHNWREKLNLQSNFQYTVKFDTNKFLELYNQGLNDKEISKILGASDSALCAYRSKLGLSNNIFNKDIPTYEQEQVIIGSTLGDMCIQLPKDSKHARGNFAHSLKQENYCKYKASILKNFVSSEFYKSEYDKRTKKTYNSYYVSLKASEYLTTIYHKFYIDGVKHVPKDLLYKLDGLGVAIWFMDDGCKSECGYNIATNCFSTENLNLIKEFFKEKFDIDISIHRSNVTYINANSKKKFTDLILPYMHQDCMYKIHDDLKTPLNRETPEKDNPMLKLQEIEENAKRLEVMPNEKDKAINTSTKAGHCSE